MPTPEEIAALLALPAAAREALAGCEGPGWHVTDDGMALPLSESPNPFRVRFAWLPCDPTEILAATCLDGRQWRMETCDDHLGDPAIRVRRMGLGDTVEAKGSTARLATLRLLAAVS